MFRALQDLLRAVVAPAGAGSATEHSLELATAVLLVEVMQADPDTTAAERTAVLSAMRRKFALGEEELSRVIALAEEKTRVANDFFAFTSTLNDHFDHPQKVRMVELMWGVAFADGDLDANENHLVSKVAGLLHVTHGEYIAAKLHAKQAAGLLAP